MYLRRTNHIERSISSPEPEPVLDIDAVAGRIAKTQKKNGEIPWHSAGKTDPWDHVESAMGLSIGGYFKEARRAYAWIKKMQIADGSWYAAYQDGSPMDQTHDTNMSSYIAVGVWHYYLITRDVDFIKEMWETVHAAMEFTIRMQAPGGEIYWARNREGVIDPMALLTGSSSVYMSLKCALAVCGELGLKRPAWKTALLRLEEAIRHRPHLFNMTKSRFSMDWFYPILCGALGNEPARERIDKYWKKFVVEGQGVKCVSDEPWVTVAETAEFILALAAMGRRDLAEIIFTWISEKRFEDGSYWCGFTVPDMIVWPEEKITWTNAVLLLAADALYHLTPASRIFYHKAWNTSALDSEPIFNQTGEI